MKKISMLLVFVFVLSIAGAAFAAPANPFVDVPSKHWAYGAVANLAKAGIVDGYGDGTFRGDKTMTRYEMAQIVAKALAKSDKANAEEKALIDKLAVEFAAELNNLGVRVAALEKKTDNVKFTGDIRLRYDHNKVEKGDDKTTKQNRDFRTRLVVSGQINDEWSYKGRFSNVQNLQNSGSDSTVKYDYAYVTGPFLNANVKVGRFEYMPMYGVVADSTLDGAEVAFGKDLKVTLRYGKEDNLSTLVGDPSWSADDFRPIMAEKGSNTIYSGVELGYALSPDFNVKGAYHDFKMDHENSNRIWELGFDTKLSKDVTAYASYSKSNAKDENRGYALGMAYKEYDKSKAGTYQVYANYRNLQTFSTWDSTYDVARINDAVGAKGYEVGFYYIPMKNVRWHVEYVDAKDTINGDTKDKYFMTRVNFYF